MHMLQLSHFICTSYHNIVCLPLTILAYHAVNIVSHLWICGNLTFWASQKYALLKFIANNVIER